ncbi:MAG TPA: hypothetical protein VIM96_00860 [Pseudomonadales bacterium]
MKLRDWVMAAMLASALVACGNKDEVTEVTVDTPAVEVAVEAAAQEEAVDEAVEEMAEEAAVDEAIEEVVDEQAAADMAAEQADVVEVMVEESAPAQQ